VTRLDPGTRRRGLGWAQLLVAAVVTVAPIRVHACACCTENGQRLETTDALRTYERGELERVEFAATARLYTTVAFPDDIKGLAAPSVEPYGFRGSLVAGQFVFEVSDRSGKTGQIIMALPRRMTRFEVDPRNEGGQAGGTGPALYKEWRLEGEVRLRGILASGGSRATGRLILHGSGNSCTSADQFTTWTLSVRGRDTRFTFLGTTSASQVEPARKP
jgi:hypothetical protein